jgi:hypothetical protein
MYLERSPRVSRISTTSLLCLKSLVELRRRARGARPSRGDARRLLEWLRGAVVRSMVSGRLVRRSGLLLYDRVVAVQAELL